MPKIHLLILNIYCFCSIKEALNKVNGQTTVCVVNKTDIGDEKFSKS